MPTTSKQPSLSSPFKLLEKALEIYRVHFKRLVGLVFLTHIASYGIGGAVVLMGLIIALVLGAGFVLGTGTGEGMSVMTFAGIGVFIASLLVGIFLLIFISSWGTVTLVLAIATRSGLPPIVRLFKTAASSVLSYWWVMFLSSFLVMGGLSLFLIPGLIFSLWVSQAMFIVILERVNGMSALLKSREYMRGRLLAYIWRMFVIAAIWMFIYFVIGMFPYLVKLGSGEESDFANSIANIVTMVLSLITWPISTIYSILLFDELRAARGPFTLTVTTGRKLKYLAVALAGYIFFLIIPVILIIAAINPGNQMTGARDAKRRSDLVSIRMALEQYNVETLSYPYALDQLVPVYLSVIPKDPQTGVGYTFRLLGGDDGYELCAQMERGDLICERR